MTQHPGPTDDATAVTTWSLELRTAEQLIPARALEPEPTLVRSSTTDPDLSRSFYERVGADWWWVDRVGWSRDDWTAWVDRPEHELWSCVRDDQPAGYFELEAQPDNVVEIAFLGLLPEHAGQRSGLGGWLLTAAARRAWARPGTTHVWLHTCSLDSPMALPNYLARGFTVYAEAVEWRNLRLH